MMDRLMRIFVLAFPLLFQWSAIYAQQDGLAAGSAAVPPDSVTLASPRDTAGKGFDALEYSLQKRHIFRGKPFVADRFTDNTFISVHGGTEQLAPMGNSTIAWGMALKLSYGKWIDAYNAFRLSLAVEDRFKNADKTHIWNAGFDIAHMFNLSSYFGGYNQSRFFEISTVEGLKYRYAVRNGQGIHAGGVHIGFNLKMNVARDLDFFIPVGNGVINRKGVFFVFIVGHLPFLRNFEILMGGSKSRITDIWLLRSANRLYT